MNPLSVISLSTGLIFFLLGLFLRVFPPKKINLLYGYRTGFSMRNLETWKMANLIAAKLLMLSGLIMIGIGMVAFWLPPAPLTGKLAGLALTIIVVILIFYFTERHLKEHFDEHGNRRN